MKSKYLTRLMAPLAIGIMAGCATLPECPKSPDFIARTNGVESFVGTKEQVEDFARKHNLNFYNVGNEAYAEGVTMSRHRYEAATSTNLLDYCATDGCKAEDAVKRK